MSKKKKQNRLTAAKASLAPRSKIPVIEHIYELRRRLLYVAVSVALFSGMAFATENQLIRVFLEPSKGQKFIYTSPLGGINFLFSVCLYIGVALSIPVVIYNILRFLQPLMHRTTSRFIFVGSSVSGVVALAGITFGYFQGLPTALHFLFHQFHNTNQVEALITIQSYMSFVAAYLLGAALMFQLPLILLFVNRIKRLKPRKLLGYERHAFAFSIIMAFILYPNPNLKDQLLLATPIFAMYQFSIVLIWFINRGAPQLERLIEHDLALQAERAARLRQALTVHELQLEPIPAVGSQVSFAVPSPVSNDLTATARPTEPPPTYPPARGRYVDSFTTSRRSHAPSERPARPTSSPRPPAGPRQ